MFNENVLLQQIHLAFFSSYKYTNINTQKQDPKMFGLGIGGGGGEGVGTGTYYHWFYLKEGKVWQGGKRKRGEMDIKGRKQKSLGIFEI
jgi:hypothetical protein